MGAPVRSPRADLCRLNEFFGGHHNILNLQVRDASYDEVTSAFIRQLRAAARLSSSLVATNVPCPRVALREQSRIQTVIEIVL